MSPRHFSIERKKSSAALENVLNYVYEKDSYIELGGINMHARMQIVGDYIFVGFAGAMRYNKGPMQFSESEMSKIVSNVTYKIKDRRFIDFFFRRKRKIIVLSHAPILGIHDKNDICHQGFKCFRDFIEKVKPFLWLHGHVHFEGQMSKQETDFNGTKIINVYGSKIISIDGDKILQKAVYE